MKIQARALFLFITIALASAFIVPMTKAATVQKSSKKTYTIFLVGDSMTFALGPHASSLSRVLKNYYIEKNFVIDNYSEGAKNILSLPDMLTRAWSIGGTAVFPAMTRDFDILVIESYGQNPLSSLPLQEGLHEQEVTLDTVISNVHASHPNALVILYASVAPSEKDYAKGVLDLTPAMRAQFAWERRAYMEGFINYAHKRGLPLLDVYHQTLNKNGSLRTEFVNKKDYIHPSDFGAAYIQDRLGQFIISHQFVQN